MSFLHSDEQMQGAALGRKDFWRKMFKSQSAASDTSSQSEPDTSECTTAHSGMTTERRSRSRSRRISLRKKLKLPLGHSIIGLLDIVLFSRSMWGFIFLFNPTTSAMKAMDIGPKSSR